MSDPDQREWLPPAEDMRRMVAWVKRLQASEKAESDNCPERIGAASTISGSGDVTGSAQRDLRRNRCRLEHHQRVKRRKCGNDARSR